MRGILVLAGASMVAVLACRPSKEATVVSDSTLVRAMGALRALPMNTAVGPDARVRMRDSVLAAHEITSAQLESALAALASDAVRAAEVWRAIERATAATSRPIPPPRATPTDTPNSTKGDISK